MFAAAANWERLAHRWRGIAERRSAHHIEMFYSGRWRHYYTDEEFLVVMRSAILMAKRWSVIAPPSTQPPAEAEVAPPPQAASELQLLKAA